MSLATLTRLLSMGCVCGRESVLVGDRRFYVRSRLGEGGFSYVDLVEDAKTHKLFALKRMVCHSDMDEVLALKEVDYMNQLNHPNLIPCEVHAKVEMYNSRQGAQSEVLIVMPFYRKGSLWDEIEFSHKSNNPILEQRVVKMFRGVCEGVRYLHCHRPCIAHRDIKPHNVMLDSDGTPVLMDFGSMGEARVHIETSKQARAMQDLAAERCTMPYRAPELFNIEQGNVIDESVDIWSLGCTLYALCFHQSPFDEAYQKGGSIALAVLSGKINIPENHSYTSDLISLIQSLLKVNSCERPDIETVINRTETLINRSMNRV